MIGLLLLAGALGAVGRYLLDRALPATHDDTRSWWRGWPLGVLTANIIGTFALGLVLGYARAHGLDLTQENFAGTVPAADRLWLLASGFCGSLTTASTLFVGFHLLYEVRRARAIMFLLGTLVLAGAAGWLGWFLSV
ncbi:fluoride efflux transporter FluC [Glutamicibacter arilaitensis]|uniref:fluoride efflux transporter FluC n=1 Tax=Glutamicibacter arilaitensis TaxID=256701 RepID=UPI0038511BF9